jgi:hypothetical protein
MVIQKDKRKEFAWQSLYSISCYPFDDRYKPNYDTKRENRQKQSSELILQQGSRFIFVNTITEQISADKHKQRHMKSIDKLIQPIIKVLFTIQIADPIPILYRMATHNK